VAPEKRACYGPVVTDAELDAWLMTSGVNLRVEFVRRRPGFCVTLILGKRVATAYADSRRVATELAVGAFLARVQETRPS